MHRRQFLKTSIIGGATAVAFAQPTCRGQQNLDNTSLLQGGEKSRVVIAHRRDVRDRHGGVLAASVAKLLDAALENLYGAPVDLIWSTLFSPRDRIGLKVNCLAGKNLSTHHELVDAVVQRLLHAGLKKSNIFIFDRRDRDLIRAGYKISFGNGKVQCLGNDRAGFTSDIFEFGSAGSQLSTIIHSMCTKVINLPVMKDHGIVGVSGSMKNFFGVINNPNKYHMDIGDPYVADVNMLPDIRRKHSLTICDALTAQYEGGPPWMPDWAWPMNSLIAATDRVAHDQIVWELIEKKRAEKGLDTLEKAGRKPTYIATAADDRHRLGTNDRNKIELLEV